MGSRSSKLAKKVVRRGVRAQAPRERHGLTAPMGAAHAKGAEDIFTKTNMHKAEYDKSDRFRDDWFPGPMWEDLPVSGDVKEMAEAKRSAMPIAPGSIQSDIPHLASKEQNADLIKQLEFIGKGLQPVEMYNTQHANATMEQPKLPRDESKMPKSKMSLPEKKLKGYLDFREFSQLFASAQTQETYELARNFETSEKLIENILKFTKWVKQPEKVINAQQSMESGQMNVEEVAKSNPSAARVILGMEPQKPKPDGRSAETDVTVK